MCSLPHAARFWRCDLQVHSPFEPEFSPGVDRTHPAKVDEAADRLVEAALKAGLDAIALTDHNSIEFLEPLAKAAKGKLVFFPSIEVSAGDGYHVLCLFDPGTPVADLRAFLNKIGVEAGQARWEDGNVRVADREYDFTRVVQEVDRRHGICVAPHVRRAKGLLANPIAGDVRARHWRCEELLAVEDDHTTLEKGTFEDDCLLNRRDAFKRDRPLARVWGSDAKSYDEIGSSHTYIKMVEPSVEGLRQAFLDPDSRIRHPDFYEVTRRERIIEISWEGGFLGGEELTFSEQLTCLIGGKGTGKSTVIESLRFVIQEEHRDGAARQQYDKLLQNALQKGTKVRIVVERRDGSRYVISRTAPYDAEVYDSDENLLELSPRDVIEFDIFSQGQILETARRPAAHLALLDSFVEDELADLKRTEGGLLTKLADNRQQLAQDLGEAEQRVEDAQRTSRLEEARKAFDKKGIAARTQLGRQLDREERLVADMRERLAIARKALESFAPFATTPPLLNEELPHAEVWAPLTKAWQELDERARKAIDGVDSELDQVRAQLDAATNAESSWVASVRSKREDVARVYRELQEEYPDLDLSQFDRIDRELQELKMAAGDPKQAAAELKRLERERKGLLSALTETRAGQFRLRQNLARKLTEDLNGAVKIEVEFEAERDVFAAFLGDFKTGTRSDVLKGLVADTNCTPEGLGDALRASPDELTKKFKLTTAQATSMIERLSDHDRLAIQEFAIPDRVSIEFNVADTGSPRYRDLTRLSVGQKATSILLILLAQRGRPLIVDQPEDDLDNRFIYKDVVGRLRRTKDERQLILATHNANIPVLGDAELIAVLEAEEVGGNPAGRIVDVGSIDADSVKRSVTQILEGGEEAFRRRREKYGVPSRAERSVT